MSTRWLVMFAKAPRAGQVKTRLTPQLSPQEAALWHEAFLRDGAALLLAARQARPARLVLATAGGDHPVFDALEAMGFERMAQGPGDLGERMAQIARDCQQIAPGPVIITGSDSPTLPVGLVVEAIDALERTSPDAPEVAFVPSFDGGYVLVGLRHAVPEIFAQIAWSTPQVLAQSLARCRRAGRLYALLAFWYDVDTFEDLERMASHLTTHLIHHDSWSADGLARHTLARVTSRWPLGP